MSKRTPTTSASSTSSHLSLQTLAFAVSWMMLFAGHLVNRPWSSGPTAGALWSIPASHGDSCDYSIQQRDDGGDVHVLAPDCFFNPLLSIHKVKSGLSRGLCRRLIQAAERRGQWSEKSALGVPTLDQGLEEVVDLLSPRDVEALEIFIGKTLGSFVAEHFLLQRPDKDGALMSKDGRRIYAKGDFPYLDAVTLKGMPFIIKYDADGREDGRGAGGGRPAASSAALARHKDNADVSFILLLSDPDSDFDGGGTSFDALGGADNPLALQQAEVLVFNGQLVHAAAPITRGKRYVLSGFTNFGDKYLEKLKRLGTLDTLPYHH
eukprot:g3880.t1